MRRVVFRPEGVYVSDGDHEWPLVAEDAEELTQQLEDGGHLVSLPKESAALANVIEAGGLRAGVDTTPDRPAARHEGPEGVADLLERSALRVPRV